MKNKHIKNLSQEVPPQIRVEVYEEAIKRTEIAINNYDKKHDLPFDYSAGLCLLLPVCLWDLKDCHQETPDGSWWSHYDTLLAFPELGDNIKSLKRQLDDDYNDLGTPFYQGLNTRINFLKKFIQQIQNTNTNENSNS